MIWWHQTSITKVTRRVKGQENRRCQWNRWLVSAPELCFSFLLTSCCVCLPPPVSSLLLCLIVSCFTLIVPWSVCLVCSFASSGLTCAPTCCPDHLLCVYKCPVCQSVGSLLCRLVVAPSLCLQPLLVCQLVSICSFCSVILLSAIKMHFELPLFCPEVPLPTQQHMKEMMFVVRRRESTKDWIPARGQLTHRDN